MSMCGGGLESKKLRRKRKTPASLGYSAEVYVHLKARLKKPEECRSEGAPTAKTPPLLRQRHPASWFFPVPQMGALCLRKKTGELR